MLAGEAWLPGFEKMMALASPQPHCSRRNAFVARSKIVNFTVVKNQPEQSPSQQELASFEELMLPHLDAAITGSSAAIAKVTAAMSKISSWVRSTRTS